MGSTTERWRLGHRDEAPPALPVTRFEVTPEGGLYTFGWQPTSLVIEHRATCSFDETPRRVARIDRALSPDLPAVVDADGTLVVALFAKPGGVVLLRLREPGKRGAGITEGMQTDLASRGPRNFLVLSPRGLWFVTGGGGRGVSVYEALGPRFTRLTRLPFILSAKTGDQPLAACSVGNQLAVVIAGADGNVVAITDGVVARRTNGVVGRGSGDVEPTALLASPAGDALLFAFPGGVARCDLLREGDARLALPAYDEAKASTPSRAAVAGGPLPPPTTFADGSIVASLRWTGPEVAINTHGGMLARRGNAVVLASGGTLTPLQAPFGPWPLEPGRPEVHGQQHQPLTQLAFLSDKELLASDRWTTLWRVGLEKTSISIAGVCCFEPTPDGGLFTVRREGHGGYFVEHRATSSVDAEPRVLGQVTRKGVAVCTALAPDGALLLAMFDGGGLGGPIGLYRARAAGGGSFEVLQRYPGSTSKGAGKADHASRTEIVAVGGQSFLVPSSRGVWFVTGSRFPTQPGVWPPIHVVELVGERLDVARPPFALPQEKFDRPFAACAIGQLLAVGTNGVSVGVTITDGLVARRVEGHYGGPRTAAVGSSLLASPRGDALLVAGGRGIMRCDLLRPGDPRLAEAPYEQPQPPEPQPEAPPPPIRRDAWVERARLVHVIRSISAVHYDPGANPHGFEGDAARGRSFAFDGSGNHEVVGWSDAGAIAMSFDHDFSRARAAELFENMPKGLASLAEELIGWKKPINDVAWFSVADDRGGGALLTHRLGAWKQRDEEVVCADWKELHAISDAQLALARALARATASGRHTLTEAEANVVLAHPDGSDVPPEPKRVEAAARHLAAVGVDWAAPAATEKKRAKRAAKDRGYEVIDAVYAGDHDALRALIAAGANLDKQAKRTQVPRIRPSGGLTPLSIAVTKRDVEMVRLLLDAGADIDARTAPFPVLHAAARAGSRAICELLLARGAIPAAPSFQACVVEGRSAEVFDLCLDRGWIFDRLNASTFADLEAAFVAQSRADVVEKYKAQRGA